MSSQNPYYRRSLPTPQDETKFSGAGTYVDLTNADLRGFGDDDTAVQKATELFDARAAAVIRAAVAPGTPPDGLGPINVFPAIQYDKDHVPLLTSTTRQDLLALQSYLKNAPDMYIPKVKCLAALAYHQDFFRETKFASLSGLVEQAILAASPGWCGAIGPGYDNTGDVLTGKHNFGGDYDMSQMHLIPMAYRYFDVLSPKAREWLIQLLKGGRIHRVSLDDIFTSGGPPDDWSRAGFVGHDVTTVRLGETENHILMMMTARYLTNQLLYQRDPRIDYDNRRNDPNTLSSVRSAGTGKTGLQDIALASRRLGPNTPTPGSCAFILLELLQSMLRDDFSEYNAKPYQNMTRWALLNLCSYAYDHEVRLGARMVLDYLSAHMAVSSNDLRRMLPFRRRNELTPVPHSAHTPSGAMTVGVLKWQEGADQSAPTFALQAGNTRIYESVSLAGFTCHIDDDGGEDYVVEALSDYRLPRLIHDLFLNYQHRRFFQRLHRTARTDEDYMANPHNADNMEIYASSPSYLITAGGGPSEYAIDPRFAGVVIHPDDQEQQRGVAVTTSFMPTIGSNHSDNEATNADTTNASGLIQLDGFYAGTTGATVANYGVAPDFACGYRIYLPPWLQAMIARGSPACLQIGRFTFVDKGSTEGGKKGGRVPGFFLAVYQEDGLAFLEAFDTWLRPQVTFDEFVRSVMDKNSAVHVQRDVDCRYTTWNGNHVTFRIRSQVLPDGVSIFISEIRHIEYSGRDRTDILDDVDRFLNGTVMNSPREAVVEIFNPSLGGDRLILDMSDHRHPRRTPQQAGREVVEQAGFNNEVWVDFEWPGPSRGDVYEPFTTIAAAAAAAAEGGVIHIIPGSTRERPHIPKKRMTFVAPIGGVTWGSLGVGTTRTWTLQTGTVAAMVGVAFSDHSHGFAVGGNGSILSTVDGGVNWVPQNPEGPNVQLRHIATDDVDHAWAVGDGGVILTTVDSGSHWTLRPSGTGKPLFGVAFPDATHGWAVGEGGIILHTDDGGVSWTPQTNGDPALADLIAVDFVDINTGWAVGTSGTIVGTTDGGGTWTVLTSGTTAQLLAVAFADASNGVAVGRDGTIVGTTDGGTTFSVRPSGTNAILLGVALTDPFNGWVVGSNGTILTTADGGLTWDRQDSHTVSNLFGLTFTDASHGWAVGGDLVLRFS